MSVFASSVAWMDYMIIPVNESDSADAENKPFKLYFFLWHEEESVHVPYALLSYIACSHGTINIHSIFIQLILCE